MPRRLRVLTWHVHGNYLHYLSHAPHEFHIVTDRARTPGYSGRGGTLPWRDNVIETPLESLADAMFDCVLYQSRQAYDEDRVQHLSPAQRALPALYLEHDPPQEHPTGTRHWVDDPRMVLVHCTPFNALMWDSNRTPVVVIEHGVRLVQEARWNGGLERGLVVVNNLARRGRRLGADIFAQARAHVPLDLVGMNAAEAGGIGEADNATLPARMAGYRFFFNPIRYTSMGLAVIEAMLVGLPVVALATTEMPTVIRDGVHGYLDTRPARLVERMHALLADHDLARTLGLAARQVALERFGIERFAADWDRVLRNACA